MTHIDISRIPADKLDRPDFLKLKAEMEQALSHKGWVNAFCIHEAGHMTYFNQLGVTDYVFQGPQIVYNEATDSFDGFMASVKPKVIPAIQDIDPQELQSILSTSAKAHAAGRVFTQRLTAAPNTGDEGDRENFEDRCNTIEKLFGVPKGTLDRQESWAQAEKEIRRDLRGPQFRREAWKMAREIEDRLFGT